MPRRFGVAVGVCVAVAVGVRVRVDVAVAVGVRVGVFVSVGYRRSWRQRRGRRRSGGCLAVIPDADAVARLGDRAGSLVQQLLFDLETGPDLESHLGQVIIRAYFVAAG